MAPEKQSQLQLADDGDDDFAENAGPVGVYELKYKAPVKLVVNERAGVVERRADGGFADSRGCDDWRDGWDF